MFPVAGIESLAGGRTGAHPYSGADGEKRWEKMKENVVKEWEAEQEKKGEGAGREDGKGGGGPNAGDKEVSGLEGVRVAGEKDEGVKEGRLDRLKAKLFKR